VDYGEAVAQVWRATKGTWDVPVAEVPLAEVPMPPPRFRGNVEASAPTDPESNPDPGDEVDDGLWWPVVNGRVLRSGDCPDRG
jgi:hypothetical protein